MGPIAVITVGVVAVLWFLGYLTPYRLRWIAAAGLGLAALRVLAMGQPLVGAALLVAAGWLGYSNRRTRADDLSVDAARALLGVSADANEADINTAYRRRIADVHPDKGGSDDASRAVNAAREVLMKQFRATGRSPQ